MRKLFAAAAVLALSSSYGAEELKFGDVNYFLKQGQFNLSADASQTFYKETPKTGSELETRGYLFETRYGFGISDRLNVYLGLDYAWDREVENITTPTNAAFAQDGLAAPTLAANYRLLNQNDDLYNLDLGAVARINIEDAETGYAVGQDSADGNYSAGRNALELNARMGSKWNEANEWQLAAGVVYNQDGDRTQKASGGDEDFEIDDSFDAYLRATYQYRPVNEFMILLSAQASRLGEVTQESDANEIVDPAHVDLDFVFRAKYLITESLVASFRYDMARNARYDREFNGTGVALKRRQDFFGLGVDFLF